MKKDSSFLCAFDAFVSEVSILKQWRPATAAIYGSLRNHIKRCFTETDTGFPNQGGIPDLARYLNGAAGVRNTTARKYLRAYRHFLGWAATNRICRLPLSGTALPRLRIIDRKVIFLEWEELLKMYSYGFSQKEAHLAACRDVFCFCCFTSLRYSDAANLKHEDIWDDHISIVTVKTSCPLRIELNKYSKAILAKYSGINRRDGRALPVISNQKMNKYLKIISMRCGICEPVSFSYFKGSERIDECRPKYELISTHCARRTFICNALAMGIPPHIIMKWTGHKDYKAMRPYMDVTDTARSEAMGMFDRYDGRARTRTRTRAGGHNF